MIKPLSINFNTARNLEPVEIPHFRGTEKPQDNTNATNNTDGAQLRGPLTKDTVDFSTGKQ